MARFISTQLKGVTVRALGEDEKHEAHTDPYSHLDLAEQLVNDPDGQLEEAAALAERRAATEDETWRDAHGALPAVDAVVDVDTVYEEDP